VLIHVFFDRFEQNTKYSKLLRILNFELKQPGSLRMINLKLINLKLKVWFQNRRAKYRKHEKQIQKVLPPILSSANNNNNNNNNQSNSSNHSNNGTLRNVYHSSPSRSNPQHPQQLQQQHQQQHHNNNNQQNISHLTNQNTYPSLLMNSSFANGITGRYSSSQMASVVAAAASASGSPYNSNNNSTAASMAAQFSSIQHGTSIPAMNLRHVSF
jgi:hypothetical protein